MPEKTKDPFQFWEELKRRRVIRVITVYAAAAFVLLELVDIISEPFGLPDWTLKLVTVLLVIGFIISVILSWIYDVTPEGIQRTKSSKEVASVEAPPASKGWKVATFVSVLIIIAFVVFYIVGNNKKSSDLFKLEKTIAVLPFMNNTGADTLDHWEYGISDLIINSLSVSEELSVIDNQTIHEVIEIVQRVNMASIGPEIAKEVATRVKVDSYIYGNYLLADSTFRINLKLIDTKSSKVLKTSYVEGKLNDIFSLVGSLSNSIKDYLEIEIISEGSESETISFSTTNSPEAYKYYIQGMNNLFVGKPSFGSFLKAIEIDSSFTSAYFFLCSLYLRMASFEAAIKNLKIAYQQKERLPIKLRLWIEAWMSEYIHKNPQNSLMNYIQVAEIDPLSRWNWYYMGSNYLSIEDYEKAIDAYEKILQINKQFDGDWRFVDLYRQLGRAYHKTGNHKKEEQIYRQGLKLYPDDRWLVLGHAVCALAQDKKDKADQYLKQHTDILEKNGWPESYTTFWEARIYLGSGNIQKAENIFRQALELRLEESKFEKSAPTRQDLKFGNAFRWYYFQLGDLLIEYDINIEEGMEYAQAALDSLPDHPWLLYTQGLGYYKQDRYEEAIEVLRKSEENRIMYDHKLRKLILEVEEALANQNK